MDGSLLNHYFYLSLITPAVIMLATGLVRSEKLLSLAIVCSLVSTYLFCNLAVDQQWNSRIASTSPSLEKQRAESDATYRVFTAILIAPLEAIVLTIFWGWAGWGVGGLLRVNRESLVTHLPVMARQQFTVLRQRLRRHKSCDPS